MPATEYDKQFAEHLGIDYKHTHHIGTGVPDNRADLKHGQPAIRTYVGGDGWYAVHTH